MLTTQLEDLARRLAAAQATVDTAQQDAAIALDRYQAQQQAYQDAEVRAAAAQRSAAAATVALRHAREELVAFARSSYIDGSTFPGAASLFASLTSGGPQEFVDRSVLLGAVGNDRTDVLQQVTTLQQQTARAEAAARVAVTQAATAQKRAASALAVAEKAEKLAREQRAALTAAQAALRQQLAARQHELAGLIGPAAAAAVAAHAEKAVAGQPGRPPAGLPVLVGNRTFARGGSATAAQDAIAAGLARVGTPYAWGGGGAAGPGPGLPPDVGVVGFDCSGLTQYAYAQAGIAIPRNSRAQYAALPKVAARDLRPGDLVFWAKDPANPDTIHHVALYLGGGQVLQAPESGEVVTVSPMYWDGYAGAVRPSA
jgi:cell wall-associated NlpC family hydrolase